MNRGTNAYLQTQTVTASQGEMLLMLYAGAVKFLNRAKEKIKEKDFAAKGIAISKAMDIISELDASLNAEKGGTLAENLHRLYTYCNSRLLDANLKLHIPFIDEVIAILDNLREAYASIINTPEAQKAAKMAPQMASTTRISTRPTQTTVLGRTVGQPAGRPLTAAPTPQPVKSAGFAAAAYRRDAAQAAPAAQTVTACAAPAPEADETVSAGAPELETVTAGQAVPETQPMPNPSGFGRGGFSGSLSGSALYRKMAKQM